MPKTTYVVAIDVGLLLFSGTDSGVLIICCSIEEADNNSAGDWAIRSANKPAAEGANVGSDYPDGGC